MEWQNKMQDYDNRIKQRLKIKDPYIPHFHDITFTDWRLSMTSDKEFLEDYARVIDSDHILEQDSITLDNKKQESEPVNYVGMEIGLPREVDDELHFAKVKRQVLDDCWISCFQPWMLSAAVVYFYSESIFLSLESFLWLFELCAHRACMRNILHNVCTCAHKNIITYLLDTYVPIKGCELSFTIFHPDQQSYYF